MAATTEKAPTAKKAAPVPGGVMTLSRYMLDQARVNTDYQVRCCKGGNDLLDHVTPGSGYLPPSTSGRILFGSKALLTITSHKRHGSDLSRLTSKDSRDIFYRI